MAQAPKSRNDKGLIARTLNILNARRTPEKLDNINISKLRENAESYSDQEKRTIIEKIRKTPSPSRPPAMNVNDYFDQHFYTASSNRVENLRILRMDTAISRAAEIMPPTIISPNDLNQKKYKIICDESSLEADQRDKITEYLTEKFEEHFNLSSTLVKDIREAYFISGAVCWLILPQTSFEAEVKRGTKISKESLERLDTNEKNFSPFGINNFTSDTKEEFNNFCLSTEDLGFDTVTERFDSKTAKPNRSQFHNRWSDFASSIVSQEALSLSDNPSSIRRSRLKNHVARNRMSKAAKTMGQGPASQQLKDLEQEEVIQFIHSDKDFVGEPMMLEIPKESVIPLFVPGTPNDHIGYFIILDENGNPASLESPEFQNQPNFNRSWDNQSSFTSLYSAFGFNDAQARPRSTQANSVMASLYEKVISSYLESKAKKGGYDSVKLGSNPAIYRYMLNRYLAGKKARIIFVPADMLVYFAFEQDAAGNGVSKLENIKFLLSLKLSLMVAQSLSVMDSAINRRKINLNLDNKNQGYILQMASQIQEQDIKKNMFTFSSDPGQVAQQIYNKAYSFNITGQDNFNIQVENMPNDRSQNQIDTGFLESLANDVILGLDLPPAAMNSLKEGEYAASVVTTNILFANKVMIDQKSVKEAYNKRFQMYTRYSQSTLRKIKEILKIDDNDSSLKDGSLEIKNNGTTKDEETRLNNIIESIQLHLSPPNMANNKAQTEALSEITQQVESLVNSYWNDDLMGSDSKLHESLALCRGMVKQQLFKKLTQNQGLDDINGFTPDKFSLAQALKVRQAVANMSKAIDDQNRALLDVGPNAESDQYGGGGMDSGFGGSPMDGGDPSAGGDQGGSDFGGFNDPNGGMDGGGDLPQEEGTQPQDNQPDQQQNQQQKQQPPQQ